MTPPDAPMPPEDEGAHPSAWLRGHPEPMPDWLASWSAEATFDAQAFFGGRTVYYPGSGSDGQPVALFGGSHAAHAFVYVDAHEPFASLVDDLHGRGRGRYRQAFSGYAPFDRRELSEAALVPWGWSPSPLGLRIGSRVLPDTPPYAHLVVLERDGGLDDAHGPKRLAVLFLGADGHAAFDALYAQPGSPRPPFALVVQDHAFSGNPSAFGRGGVMEAIATAAGAWPHLLLVAENSRPWRGYVAVPGVGPSIGGMYGTKRRLYVRGDGARAHRAS